MVIPENGKLAGQQLFYCCPAKLRLGEFFRKNVKPDR